MGEELAIAREEEVEEEGSLMTDEVINNVMCKKELCTTSTRSPPS
jgi:hypothetical protein